MHPNVSRILFAGLGLALASQAQAATVTGNINATLTLTAACQVNGSTATTGVNFGNLDFGSQIALFTEASAQVIGTGGGGAISVLCSPGATPVVKVGAGAHDAATTGGSRALAMGTNYVPYDFYTDAGHTNLLAINGTITLATSTGVAQTVNMYGRAVGKPSLPPGVYTDTVAVELSF